MSIFFGVKRELLGALNASFTSIIGKGLVTHTAKINAGNPTHSLETQSIAVLYKNSVFKS